MLFRLLILMAIVAIPASAEAQSPISLSSDVFVERSVKDADGKIRRVLEEPKTVLPGDPLLFVVKYRNAGKKPANKLVVTNPLPSAVAFRETMDGNEEVSVDGGRHWGRLDTLRIALPDGTDRAAEVDDVTHIRWTINRSVRIGSEGKFLFRGVVK